VDDIKYLFIDGSYLQRIHRSAMEAVFGVPGDLNVQRVANDIHPFRTYYYDCVEEQPKTGESQSDFEARMAPRLAHIAQIRSLPGGHVRLGTLSGRQRKQKEPRQKEVDILIAVDMLTHGFNRNMRRAALLAGDLDFRPLVEASVQAGVFVELWYEKTSTNENLYWAADQGRPIEWQNLYDWNTDAFRLANCLPAITGGGNYLISSQIARGTCAGRSVELIKLAEKGPFVLHPLPNSNQSLKHTDRQVLERYFSMKHGPIVWTSSREG